MCFTECEALPYTPMGNLGILLLYWTCTETLQFQYSISTVMAHFSIYLFSIIMEQIRSNLGLKQYISNLYWNPYSVHKWYVLFTPQIGTILFHNNAESEHTVTSVYWIYTVINTFAKRTDKNPNWNNFVSYRCWISRDVIDSRQVNAPLDKALSIVASIRHFTE